MDGFTDSSLEGQEISKTLKNVASENVQNHQKFINSVLQDGIGSFVSDQIDNKSSECGERSNAVELLAAAGEGQVEVVKRILEDNRDMIIVADPMGDTAFHLAVRAGHYDVVLEVIRIASMRDQLGRVMVEKNVDGDTVLELASKIGNSEVTECLDNEYVPVLLRESGMYLPNKDGKYPWEVVQQPGYKKLISEEVYMEYMRNLEENPRGEEKTLCTWDNLCKHCSEMKLIEEVVDIWAKLCWAIVMNQEVMVMQILREEPRLIQYTNEYQGGTVLHLAVHSWNLGMIDLLVQYITNNHPNPCSELARLMSITNDSGENPLDVAIECRFLLAAFYLTELAPQAMFQLYTSGFSPLQHAVKKGYCNLVSFMIDQAQASDASIKEGLHSHAMEARLPHAAINTRHLGTAFHIAAYKGEAMIRTLVQCIITNNPNSCNNELARLMSVRDNKGENPLLVATGCRDLSSAFYLAQVAPQAMFQVNYRGVCPLYRAIQRGLQDLLSFMIDQAQLSESMKEKFFSHAMQAYLAHVAIKAKHLGVLRVLMEKLPYLINSSNDNGWKPLSYAASRGYYDHVSFLLTNFPNSVSELDKDGSMPIHKAIAGGNILIVKEFISRFPATLCDIDQKGRTTLHIATVCGKAEILYYLLNQKDVKKILNLRDKKGKDYQDLLEELKNRTGGDSSGKDDANAGLSQSKLLD